MKLNAYRAVVVQKADLDTACAGFLLGVTNAMPVVLVDAVASRGMLDDPAVLCLECGGAGAMHLGNFDHHDPEGPEETAAEQAWASAGKPATRARLVQYVAKHDRGLTEPAPNPDFSLIGMFSAMRGAVSAEDERFRAGLSLLRWFVALDRDPRGPLVDLDTVDSLPVRRELASAVAGPPPETYDFGTTASGRRLAIAADGIGLSPRQLYAMGFGIVIAERARFGEPPRRRFTVALDPKNNDLLNAVNATNRIRKRLGELESDWGGPSVGTILGSPRDRSSVLSLADVVQVCREEA